MVSRDKVLNQERKTGTRKAKTCFVVFTLDGGPDEKLAKYYHCPRDGHTPELDSCLVCEKGDPDHVTIWQINVRCDANAPAETDNKIQHDEYLKIPSQIKERVSMGNLDARKAETPKEVGCAPPTPEPEKDDKPKEQTLADFIRSSRTLTWEF